MREQEAAAELQTTVTNEGAMKRVEALVLSTILFFGVNGVRFVQTCRVIMQVKVPLVNFWSSFSCCGTSGLD